MNMDKDIIEQVLQIARDAGDKIMEIYQDDSVDFELKDDGDNFISPLTKADTTASDVIVKGLAEISELPIVNEENELSHTIYADEYWLIDPLDGTKEFIKKNGEFTVNIALIKDEQPEFGVVYAPALDTIYWTDDENAMKQIGDGDIEQINVREPDPDNLVAVASRSHVNEETQNWLDEHNIAEKISRGSSLKFCLVAEGVADYYPRFVPTMLWDTGAAHAIVRAAGGVVIDQDTDKPLTYKLDQLKNPSFVCKSA